MMNNNNRLPSYNSITDYHPPLSSRGEAEESEEQEQEQSLIYSACTSDADNSILTDDYASLLTTTDDDDDDEEEEEDTTSAITPDYYFEQDPFNYNNNGRRYYQTSDASTTTGSSVPPPPPPPLPRSSTRHHPSNVYRRSSNSNNSSNKSKCSSSILYWIYIAGFLALGSITLSILIVSGNENFMDWINTTKEIGLKGRRAQNLADQSSIVGMCNPRHPSFGDESESSSSSSTTSTSSTSSSWTTVSAAGNNQDNESKEVVVEGTDKNDNDVDVPLLGSSKKKLQDEHDEEETTLPLLSKSIDEGCETTVMIIRHCERGNLKSHCNYLGYERAKHLSTLFGNEPDDLWPLPSQIYAMQTKKHHYEHVREVETVKFVALKAEIEIDSSCDSGQIRQLADTIISNITSGDMCGKLILISWKHADIPKLANHLGCGPLQGCPVDYKGDSFDPVWQIKYVYRNFLSGQKKKKKTSSSSSKSSSSTTIESSYWDMYGTVQSQHFDPLAFSKKFGDYPLGGTSKGGRWNTNYDNNNGYPISSSTSGTTTSSAAVVKQFYG